MKIDSEKTIAHLKKRLEETALNNIGFNEYVYLDIADHRIETWVNEIIPEQPEQKEPCSACDGLEEGDTLYAHSEWDGGIGFDYIYDIKYCPVCGRKLPRWDGRWSE